MNTRIGAVIYDPRVTVIWDIIGRFFAARGEPLALSFYADYDLQVDALVEDRIDVAWNSPLAWLDVVRARAANAARSPCATRTAIASRTSSRAPGRAAWVPEGPDARNGASDPPQATLIPLEWLRAQGLEEGHDYTARFEVGVGLHGDHVGGELEAFQALERGEVDACVVLDLNRDAGEGRNARRLALRPDRNHRPLRPLQLLGARVVPARARERSSRRCSR